jgi:hypothetical protein
MKERAMGQQPQEYSRQNYIVELQIVDDKVSPDFNTGRSTEIPQTRFVLKSLKKRWCSKIMIVQTGCLCFSQHEKLSNAGQVSVHR